MPLELRKELTLMAANLLCASDDLKSARQHEEVSDFAHAVIYLTEVRDFCRRVAESADAAIFECQQREKEGTRDA